MMAITVISSRSNCNSEVKAAQWKCSECWYDTMQRALYGKITLHLLFGWSLDKDEKSLDQSKQFSWQFGSIQTKAFPNPDQPPLEIFLINQYFCTKNKIIDNEKWKLLETLQYTIKEFNNGNVVCSTMHCPNGSRWGGGREKGCTDFVYSIV